MDYDPDRAGGARFLKSQAAQDLCGPTAREIAALAKRLTKEKSGRHKRSIRARSAEGLMGNRSDRRGWEVVADAPYSAYVEFGGITRNGTVVPGDHALRRATAQLSGRGG